MTNTPILFLIFNRPDTTELVFNAIREAQPTRLYIASDGPRKTRIGEAEKVQAIRDYVVNSVDWVCDVKLLFRTENLGCGPGVSSAISWFFEHEEMGIILEDDCLPSQSFFPYCTELLERYKDNDRIMMIAGGNYLFSELALSKSYSFCKYQLIWGWASWRRAWKNYDPNISDWPIFKSSKEFARRVPDFDERIFWRQVFNRTHIEKLGSTWDYQWLFSMWKSGGLSIFPKSNLITNIGFGEAATHTIGDHCCSNIQAATLDFPLTHPAAIVDNDEANHIICTNFYMRRRGLSYLTANLLGRLKVLLRKALRDR